MSTMALNPIEYIWDLIKKQILQRRDSQQFITVLLYNINLNFKFANYYIGSGNENSFTRGMG